MGAAIGLRGDFGAGALRALARGARDANRARRRLALAADRPDTVGVARVLHLAERGDHESGGPGAWRCEALGPPASSRPE